MTTQDFKQSDRITIHHSRWLVTAYAGLHLVALLCVVIAHMPVFAKLLLFLVLVWSALHVRVYLANMFRVKYLLLEDKKISVVYGDQTVPMSIVTSPVVMDWLVILTLHQLGHGSWLKRWVDALVSVVTFSSQPAKAPGSVTLLLFASCCSKEEHSALRRFLLTYSYNAADNA